MHPFLIRLWAQLCGVIVQACAVSLDRLVCAVPLSRQGIFDRAAEVVLLGLWLR